MSVCSADDAIRGDVCAPSRAIELPIGDDIRGVAGPAVVLSTSSAQTVFAKAFHANGDPCGPGSSGSKREWYPKLVARLVPPPMIDAGRTCGYCTQTTKCVFPMLPPRKERTRPWR